MTDVVLNFKVCTVCRRTLVASPVNFHRQAKGLFGLTSKCKMCKGVEIERWRQVNLDLHRSYKVKWREDNRELYLAVKRRDAHRRRMAKQGPSYTVTEWLTLAAAYDNRCAACGAYGVTVDHVVALARGGANTIDNIQPLCPMCNSRKGVRTIDYRWVAA